MMRISSRPLPEHCSRRSLRVATWSTVLRMVSINCRSTLVRNSGDTTKWSLESDGSARVVGCDEPSAAVLARAR
eukprot:5098822-Pleurochrysis_carterae.AAC.1